ncbi:MAG TPA: isoaspartyl peptidase/L-asparaginase [Gemmatimonadaceae bacterium]|nr:isoaspartyl peptidase/L-asparaginase [Gemmatimonadaceae bacterium]
MNSDHAPDVASSSTRRRAFMLVAHGGAGTIRKRVMTPEQRAAYREAMTDALRAGCDVLSAEGTSLDAVQAVITVLEDSPLFNAGKGAVFTHDGTHEQDAAIMDGSTLRAGAVAGVQHIAHPIALARLVMERTKHVMLSGDGAEAFAREEGVPLVPSEYFSTERRWAELEKARQAEEAGGAAGAAVGTRLNRDLGTVGAVALDVHGNLAAGTSTGGVTNKRWGRIGDSPIIGAGTYANNACAALSATGIGEHFIRNVVTYDICARMIYGGESLDQAARHMIGTVLVAQHGDGGLIGVDRDGNITMPFNTEGMYRGFVGPDGAVTVKIFE